MGVVASLRREALGQEVLGLLGLADASEVVLEARPNGGGHRDDGDDTGDPPQKDRSPMVVALPPNAAEHVGTGLRNCLGALNAFWSRYEAHRPNRRQPRCVPFSGSAIALAKAPLRSKTGLAIMSFSTPPRGWSQAPRHVGSPWVPCFHGVPQPRWAPLFWRV